MCGPDEVRDGVIVHVILTAKTWPESLHSFPEQDTLLPLCLCPSRFMSGINELFGVTLKWARVPSRGNRKKIYCALLPNATETGVARHIGARQMLHLLPIPKLPAFYQFAPTTWHCKVISFLREK